MIEYQEISMADVIGYFVKGFELKGQELTNYDWFYDPVKGKVVFKLYLRDTVAVSTDQLREIQAKYKDLDIKIEHER